MAKKIGRPKITIADLPSGWLSMIPDEMTKGASLEEIKAKLDIADSTYYRLMKENKRFSSTIKRGKSLSKAWWLRQGRENLENKQFSFVGWYMNMKNRFKWRDRQDLTSGDEKIVGPIVYKPENKNKK